MSFIQPLNLSLAAEQGVTVSVKRDDLVHPVISGNKFYKLKYNLQQARLQNVDCIITFGGAYSNHLHATAFACRQANMKSIAVVRGEQILPLNPTLRDCVAWGMTLYPVSRAQYREKESTAFQAQLREQYPNSYWVPEGGANKLGVQGAGEILADLKPGEFDFVVAACGTGTTLAGLINSAPEGLNVIGVPVLKNAQWMQQDIQQWLEPESEQVPWALWYEYDFGGYGKCPTLLTDFIERIEKECALPLDGIYTAKAFFGLMEKIQQGYFPSGSRILFCHTGGLQGMRKA